MLSVFISTFVLAFSTLLPVINPFSGAMFFCTMTQNLTPEDRLFVANRIALYSFVILLVCLSVGHVILNFFGISVGALRVAGGLVLFMAGWSALNAPSHDENQKDVPSISRTKLKSMAFYPFTLPLTTGPGGIAVSVALGTSLPRDTAHVAGVLAATVAMVIVIWFCYRYSDRVNQAVGAAGADALARLFAFILICLGVSITWQGFSELWMVLQAKTLTHTAELSLLPYLQNMSANFSSALG